MRCPARYYPAVPSVPHDLLDVLAESGRLVARGGDLGQRLDGLAEHVVNRELESLHGHARILAVQLLLPQSRELFFGQKCVEQGLDRIGAFVPCALLAATEFFVTFVESNTTIFTLI